MPNTFIRGVVRIREPFFPTVGKRFRIHGVPVILRSDVAAAGRGFDARLILRAVSVFQLVRAGARGEGEKLVAKANTEYRFTGFKCLSNMFDGNRTCRRVSRAVRYEEAIVFFFGEVVIPWDTQYVRASGDERAHDILLHAAIDGDDARAPLPIDLFLFDADARNQILFVRVNELFSCAGMNELAKHDTVLAELLRERTGINAGYRGHAGFFEPFAKRVSSALMRIVLAVFGYDEPRHLYFSGFEELFARNAIIADERIRADQDLPGVRRVGKCFYIPDHAGVENDFSGDILIRAETFPRELRTVF